MRNFFFAVSATVVFISLLLLQVSCAEKQESKPLNHEEMVARGKYLVNFGGCNDCHTPKIYTENGPVFDTTKLLAGHFEGTNPPIADMNSIGQNGWVMTESNFTAWVGPWGISYAANLTPDKATGIGTLTEEMFIKSLKEGKWMGVGRSLMPPMPWQGIGSATDEDLKCIYAYLMSIKPIHNTVPQPTPPDKAMELFSKK